MMFGRASAEGRRGNCRQIAQEHTERRSVGAKSVGCGTEKQTHGTGVKIANSGDSRKSMHSRQCDVESEHPKECSSKVNDTQQGDYTTRYDGVDWTGAQLCVSDAAASEVIGRPIRNFSLRYCSVEDAVLDGVMARRIDATGCSFRLSSLVGV